MLGHQLEVALDLLGITTDGIGELADRPGLANELEQHPAARLRDPPTITVLAGYSKRRRDDCQPLRRDLADQLRPWLAAKPTDRPVLDLPERTAKMVRRDLAAAREQWLDEASTAAERKARIESDFLHHKGAAGRICDFHALRHTFISRIVESGASVKVAQELARHSTPVLTIGRYSHTRLHDLTGALEALPKPRGGLDDAVAGRTADAYPRSA